MGNAQRRGFVRRRVGQRTERGLQQRGQVLPQRLQPPQSGRDIGEQILVERRRLSRLPGEVGPGGLDRSTRQAPDDGFLGGEVVEQRAAGDLGGGGDIAGGRRLEPLFGEQ